MSFDPTNPDRPPMSCERVINDELAEKYLLNQMGDEEREAFELHFFECRRCMEEMDAYRALRAELEAEGARIRNEQAGMPAPLGWRWMWAAGVAVALAIVGITVWTGRPTEREPQPRIVRTPPPPPTSMPPATSEPPTIMQLARLDPPPYLPVPTRGAEDQAIVRFREAMESYQKREYRKAIAGLRAAHQLNSKVPEICFYLGASYLLAGQTTDGIEFLHQTVALGETPFLEPAHFYLAKALLLKGDTGGARRELQETIRLKGEWEDRARELLGQLAQPSRDRKGADPRGK